MTFQQHTTYEQSEKLKALGVQQSEKNSRDLFYIVGEQTPGRFYFDTAIPEHRLRALLRQEIEDMIRQDYLMLIVPFESVRVGFGYDYVERVRVDLWERSFIVEYNEDGTIAVGCIATFTCDGADPFPALYDALVWSLQQAAALPSSSPSSTDLTT